MTRTSFKECQDFCLIHGWNIRRISTTEPFGGYASGVLITDRDGIAERFSSLAEFKFHRIETTNPSSMKGRIENED